MMFRGKLVGAAVLGAGLCVGMSGLSASAGAAHKSAAHAFASKADSICKSADKAAKADLKHVSSNITKDQLKFQKLVTLLSQTGSKLQAVKAPKADAAQYAKGIKQIRSSATLTKNVVPKLTHFTAKEKSSYEDSILSLSRVGASAFGAIGLQTCAILMTGTFVDETSSTSTVTGTSTPYVKSTTSNGFSTSTATSTSTFTSTITNTSTSSQKARTTTRTTATLTGR